MSETKICELKRPDYMADVVKTLRNLADAIERGEAGEPDIAMFVGITEGCEPSVFSCGPKSDTYGTIAALDIAKTWLVNEAMSED